MLRKLRKLYRSFFRNKHIVEDSLIYKKENQGGFMPTLYGNNQVVNSNIGIHSYVAHNTILYHTEIGNYCSIGPNVVSGYGEHPIDLLSTSPNVYYNQELFSNSEIEQRVSLNFKPVKIEHDVWVGAGVFLKNGITVGTGAIIGAGSVVLKNVGPYEIVVGVPAKVIRKRFSADVVNKLLESEWWKYDISLLQRNIEAVRNPTVDALEILISDIKDKRQDYSV